MPSPPWEFSPCSSLPAAPPRITSVARLIRSSSTPTSSTTRPHATTATFTTSTSAPQAGIQQAQSSANNANQQAQTANQAANQAEASATDAVHQADSLASVVSNLDNYKQVTEVSVNFGFDKAELTKADKAKLDLFATQISETKSYILRLPAEPTP